MKPPVDLLPADAVSMATAAAALGLSSESLRRYALYGKRCRNGVRVYLRTFPRGNGRMVTAEALAAFVAEVERYNTLAAPNEVPHERQQPPAPPPEATAD